MTETKPQNITDMYATVVTHWLSHPTKSSLFEIKCNTKQRNLKDIFSCIWDIEELHQHLTPVLVDAGKSEDEANKLRLLGNQFYKQRNFEKALELYNLSIMVAPHPVLGKTSVAEGKPVNKDAARYGSISSESSQALAVGFSNRSAIMFALKIYDKCLADVNFAFAFGLAEGIRGKLEERKQQCLSALLERTSSSKDGERAPAVPSLKDRICDIPHVCPKVTRANDNMPCLSNTVKIGCSPDKGRGLFATRNIRPGEVIGVETAYCSMLNRYHLTTYCTTCMCFCLTPLPCPGCSKVIFCSESCRDKGLSEDHWIECKILPTMLSLDMEGAVIYSKILQTFSFSQMKPMLNQLKEEKHDKLELKGCDQDGIYQSTQFQAVYHLHDNENLRSSTDLLRLCLASFVLLKLLDLSGRYFPESIEASAAPTRDDFLETGAMLMSLIMKIHSNAIRCLHDKKEIASGLFPAASLINHSCNPSTTYYNIGRKLILRALRPIPAGEEIMITYSHAYEDEPRAVRKQYLKDKFFFDCHCEACKGGWEPYQRPIPSDRCQVCLKNYTGISMYCSRCLTKYKMNANIQNQVNQILLRTNLTACHLKSKTLVSKMDFNQLCEDTTFVHRHFTMPSFIINFMSNVFDKCMRAGL